MPLSSAIGASTNMDIFMDIRVKSVDVDMDRPMDVKCHIHVKPGVLDRPHGHYGNVPVGRWSGAACSHSTVKTAVNSPSLTDGSQNARPVLRASRNDIVQHEDFIRV